MKLGLNLSEPNFYQTDVKCGDVLIHQSGWTNLPPPSGTNRNFPDLPTTPGASNLAAIQGYCRPGEYVMWCGGEGTVSFDVYSCTFGPNQSFFPMALTAKNNANPLMYLSQNAGGPTGLNHLKLLGPGADPTMLWHPQYLSSISPFTGGFRFMDWMQAFLDTGAGCTWEQHLIRTGFGLEAAVDLANATGRDMWLCLPVHCLTPSGITDLPAGIGAYLGANLNPELTVHVEIGNEVWNEGSGYIAQQLYLSGIAPSLTFPGTTNNVGCKGWPCALAYLFKYGLDALIGAIPAGGPKVVRVLGGQCTDFGEAATWVLGVMAKFGWTFDALSCAPYAYWPNSGTYTTAAVAALVAAGNVSGAIDLIVAGQQWSVTQEIVPSLQQWQTAAKAAGVPLIYYEFGLGLSSLWANPGTAAAAQALPYDPRCATLVNWYLGQVSPFAARGWWYADARPDSFGSRANADDTANQIRQAILAYVAANP